MLTLTIRDMVKVSGAEDPMVEKLIDETCSYKPASFFFIKLRYKNYDGVHFYRGSIFPLGLLERVKDELKRAGIEVSVVDERGPPQGTTIPEKGALGLRPYQERAVTAFTQKGYTGIINACTGSGKTIMAIDIIKRLKTPTVIYVPTTVLLYQWKNEIENFIDMECGVIGDGKCEIRPVTVAMYQTVSRALTDNVFTKYVTDAWTMEKDTTDIANKQEAIISFIKGAGLCIMDECHTVGARTFLQVAINTPARYKLGLSATSLMRPDGADLAVIAGCGEPCSEVTTSELIKAGYLSPLTVKIVTLPDLRAKKHLTKRPKTDKKLTAEEADKAKDEGRKEYGRIKSEHVHSEGRNAKVVEQTVALLDEGRTVLVLVAEIAHGKALKGILEARLGRPVVFLSGTATGKKRMKVVDALKDGTEKLAITTSIFEYGLDVPRLSGLVIASPSKSMIKTIQRVGRILRKHPDKKDAKIVDFDDINADYFREHFKERMRFYVSEPEFVLEYDGVDPKVVQLISRPKDVKEFLFEWEKGLR